MGLLALTFVVLFLADGGLLFSRPLWSDEIQTLMVVSHPSPATVLSDLAHGADHGPPLLHLVLWGVHAVAGSISPAMLRWMGVLCVWGAIILAYAVLRRRCGRDASVAGALAVGSHILVINHGFEGRYYGPWLLLTALFAWCVSLSEPLVTRKRRDVIIAVVSVLLCTIHWYGIITMTLMGVGVMASYGRRWREGARLLMPSLAGVVALAACVPLAFRQRASLTVNTWVADFTASQLDTMAAMYWVAVVPGIAVACLVIGSFASARRDGAYEFGAVAGTAAKDPGLLALAALALLPLALVVVSLMGQPSAFPRYAIPAALAWAPLVAVAMELAGRWIARAFTAFVAVVWFTNYVKVTQSYGSFAVRTERQSADVRSAEAAGILTVFQSMHALYAVTAGDWPRRANASFLELPDSTMSALFPPGTRLYQLNKVAIVERDVVRAHAKRYGYPRVVPRALLDTTQRFLIVFDQAELPRGYTVESLSRAVFPRHRLQRVSETLWLFERMPLEPRRPL
jgi:hypothetical protein